MVRKVFAPESSPDDHLSPCATNPPTTWVTITLRFSRLRCKGIQHQQFCHIDILYRCNEMRLQEQIRTTSCLVVSFALYRAVRYTQDQYVRNCLQSGTVVKQQTIQHTTVHSALCWEVTAFALLGQANNTNEWEIFTINTSREDEPTSWSPRKRRHIPAGQPFAPGGRRSRGWWRFHYHRTPSGSNISRTW